MTKPEKKNLMVEWAARILIPVITSLAVLGGSYLTFKGDLITASNSQQVEQLEAAFKRIEHLEKQLREQQATSNAKIVQLTGEVFRLKRALDKEVNIIGMFDEFMDSLPFEAWLKEVKENEDGNPEFEMLLINKKYEYTHGISQNLYKGSTDFDIWSNQVAAKFYRNDMKAYKTRSSVVTQVKYPINPKEPEKGYQEKTIVKVYIDLLDGRKMVFGMALDYHNGQQ